MRQLLLPPHLPTLTPAEKLQSLPRAEQNLRAASGYNTNLEADVLQKFIVFVMHFLLRFMTMNLLVSHLTVKC